VQPRIVAIKKLKLESHEVVGDLQKKFMNECAFLQMRDPLIVELLGVSTDESHAVPTERYWLIMEYMENGSLSEYLRRKDHVEPITLEQRIDWCYQCVACIAQLHQQKPPVLHRDIKPANFLMDSQLNIKVGQSMQQRD
jgi:serine/threonine protein kinase